jgi:hypothetical protein
MSIFRSTLSKYVQDQLNTRKDVISSTNTRNPNFLLYTSGKNGWVRMASFVDYYSKGKYSGDDLAKKYILEAGTLNRAGDEEKLRFGINTPGGVYNSNLDGFNAKGQSPKKGSELYNDFRQLGARPMPGISSVDINSKSAYGSLKEATVRYYCWDKHQLEELELLYMRTGYTVLLEWGWSQYLESASNNIKNIGQGLDVFDNSLTDEKVYNQIENLKEKYHGNYDALLGHVKNFSWQLMPNGGYECSTVLISRGEIISTIRLTHNSLANNPTSGEDDKPLSTFEQIFLNYKAWINNLEVNQAYQEKFASTDPNKKENRFEQVKSEFKPIYKTDQQAEAPNQINETSVTNFVTGLENKLKKVSEFYIYGYNSKGVWYGDKAFISGDTVWNEIKANKGFSIPVDSSANDGSAIEYIRLDHVLAIINAYFNLKDENGALISKILIPRQVPVLASEDSVSIDPRTCLIRNPNATFITDSDIIVSTDTHDLGFQPQSLSSYTFDQPGNRRVYSVNRDIMYHFHLSKYVAGVPDSKKFSFGCLDNIYISINKIVELYRSKGGNNPDGVLLVDYLKDLMSSVSSALGGINDFQIHVDKSSIRIIDVKYLEINSGTKKDNFNKFNFDLLGLKSICRDVKISSRIFDSQATMIAISAQNRNNVGDIYSSTQSYFNKGLTDRLLSTRVVDNESPKTDLLNNDATLTYYVNLWKSVSNIAYYLKEKCIGIPNPNDGNLPNIKAPSDADINNAKSILKTIHYQINGSDIDYKALIPFELEIILDGISGLVIGQIFTIDKSILPKDYTIKNLGFIITGVNHSLQNNDWTTTVKTQCCLLDQEDISLLSFNKTQKAKIKEGLAKIKAQSLKNQYLIYAITDFLYSKIIAALATAPADHPESTHQLGRQFIDMVNPKKFNGNSIPVPTDKFGDFLPKWIKRIQTSQPLIYNKIDNKGNKVFPQTESEILSFTLDGGGQVNFNTDVADRAYGSYNAYSLNGKSTSLKYTEGSTYIDIKAYFTLNDLNTSIVYNQTAAVAARNSALWDRVFEFGKTYPEEFAGNLLYVNSIFGRGLIGNITLQGAGAKTATFNLDKNGDNEGLKVDADTNALKVSNFQAGETFWLSSVSSVFTGKNSGIEKYLSSIFLTNNKIAFLNPPRQEVWNKVFEYVTKDLLSPTSPTSTFIDPAFQSNFGELNQISDIKPTQDVSGNADNYKANDYTTIYIP